MTKSSRGITASSVFNGASSQPLTCCFCFPLLLSLTLHTAFSKQLVLIIPSDGDSELQCIGLWDFCLFTLKIMSYTHLSSDLRNSCVKCEFN